MPVVGADNNQFLKQLMTVKGFHGAAVTNPATIGGVGAAIAIKLLDGQSVPNWVKLTPQVWDNKTATGMKQIKANYSPSRPPTYSARLQVKPWTTYTHEAALQPARGRRQQERAGGASLRRPSRLSWG